MRLVGLTVASLVLLASVLLPGCGNDSHASIERELQDLLDKVVAEGNVPGIALHVIDANQGTWCLASGMADIELQTARKPAYRFRCGSVSKTFTAAAVMLLQQQGRLDLDDPIAKHVPDLQIPLDSVITIRDLLSHRSGMVDYSNETNYCSILDEDPLHYFTPQELVQASVDAGSNFYPGTEYRYCNTGYLVSALIIENANPHGLSYAEFLEGNFFGPLGLADTFAPTNEKIQGDYAHGYQHSEMDGLHDATVLNQSFALGAGNIVSTVADLAHWAEALFGGQVLDEKSTVEMMDVVATGDPVNAYYGLGCGLIPSLGYGHPGATAGYLTEMRYEPESGVSIVTSLNVSGEAAKGTLYEVMYSAKRILGYEIPAA